MKKKKAIKWTLETLKKHSILIPPGNTAKIKGGAGPTSNPFG